MRTYIAQTEVHGLLKRAGEYIYRHARWIDWKLRGKLRKPIPLADGLPVVVELDSAEQPNSVSGKSVD